MSKLILVRHGQSVWNAENRFTGWVDVDLSKKGILEAQKSGQLIKNLNINIDVSYTSFLKRAIKTLTAILQENGLELKFNTSWELNERHYGSLTGLNKKETRKILLATSSCRQPYKTTRGAPPAASSTRIRETSPRPTCRKPLWLQPC